MVVTDVAADRVSAIRPGGHDAILIEPVNPDTGYGPGASVIFVEESGSSGAAVLSNNVPLAELLAVADVIGSALKGAD